MQATKLSGLRFKYRIEPHLKVIDALRKSLNNLIHFFALAEDPQQSEKE